MNLETHTVAPLPDHYGTDSYKRAAPVSWKCLALFHYNVRKWQCISYLILSEAKKLYVAISTRYAKLTKSWVETGEQLSLLLNLKLLLYG